MKIEDVIRRKGHSVVTIAPTSSVEELVTLLTERCIGAVVVSSDGTHLEGIVSERDVVRNLSSLGADTLAANVSDIMTSDVKTASPADLIDEVAHVMTYQRIRHMPVVVDGTVIGIVSIGDVVKHHIDQLTDERNALVDYLHS